MKAVIGGQTVIYRHKKDHLPGAVALNLLTLMSVPTPALPGSGSGVDDEKRPSSQPGLP